MALAGEKAIVLHLGSHRDEILAFVGDNYGQLTFNRVA
jgi:hypothetical protein